MRGNSTLGTVEVKIGMGRMLPEHAPARFVVDNVFHDFREEVPELGPACLRYDLVSGQFLIIIRD